MPLSHDVYIVGVQVVSRISFMCDMINSYVSTCHASFTWCLYFRRANCVTYLVRMWHDPFMCQCAMPHSHDAYILGVQVVSRISFVCDTIHSYVPWLIHMRHGSFMRSYSRLASCVLRLIHMCRNHFICAMAHSYVPWMCAMTHSYVCHDSITCAMTHSNFCNDSSICVPWLIYVHDSFICAFAHS